jgi:DivIVA domain-containing protein
MQRVDQIRRSFQIRRFGSGYDPSQVDRLFDAILAAMAGRGPMPINVADLDNTRFGLVPGGYFEAEVDAALREVQDILRRR